MSIASNLGFPRIGPTRELKRALEDYWAGRSSAEELASAAAGIRRANWHRQAELGIEHIPSNDFSLYDHVLDTAVMLGAVPRRFAERTGLDDVERYFAMARGLSDGHASVPAMEMTKWFDTNYHYIVPELEPEQELRLASAKPIDEFMEAKALGVITRPVLLGPLSFLLLAKNHRTRQPTLVFLDAVLPVYEQLLAQLRIAGAAWVQLDEPCLVFDLTPSSAERTRRRMSGSGQRARRYSSPPTSATSGRISRRRSRSPLPRSIWISYVRRISWRPRSIVCHSTWRCRSASSMDATCGARIWTSHSHG